MDEVPVDIVVEIEGENGDSKGKNGDAEPKTLGGIIGISGRDPSSSCSGSVDRNLADPKFMCMEKPTECHSDPSSSQLTRVEKHKPKNSRIQLAKKFVDQKIPVRKKFKLLKRFATIQDDGTVKFEVPGDISQQGFDNGAGVVVGGDLDKETADAEEVPLLAPLQIVMLIVGTRGDVQPFVAIGKRLQADGHRVRLATHSNFKEFVLSSGLEFFPLGGDPKVLAAYMVKNKGFLPSGPCEINIQRSQIKDIIFSLLPACIERDPDTKVEFKVDAIIANPPAYGHTHVAEALKVPLHIMFTMPWTPTSEFPHPLSRVKQQVGYRFLFM